MAQTAQKHLKRRTYLYKITLGSKMGTFWKILGSFLIKRPGHPVTKLSRFASAHLLKCKLSSGSARVLFCVYELSTLNKIQHSLNSTRLVNIVPTLGNLTKVLAMPQTLNSELGTGCDLWLSCTTFISTGGCNIFVRMPEMRTM